MTYAPLESDRSIGKWKVAAAEEVDILNTISLMCILSVLLIRTPRVPCSIHHLADKPHRTEKYKRWLSHEWHVLKFYQFFETAEQ